MAPAGAGVYRSKAASRMEEVRRAAPQPSAVPTRVANPQRCGLGPQHGICVRQEGATSHAVRPRLDCVTLAVRYTSSKFPTNDTRLSNLGKESGATVTFTRAHSVEGVMPKAETPSTLVVLGAAEVV